VTVGAILRTTMLLAVLAGCSTPDVILPGERLDIRDGMPGQEVVLPNRAAPISLPAAVVNADWTHRNGGPDHQITHPALSANPQQTFSVPIGQGNTRRARITSDPVIANGRIFTLDAVSTVQATATNGAVLWTATVTPPSDSAADASGGGIATDGATVYVSTGFGRLTALDATTGGVRWTQVLNAPGGSAPTVMGDLVYVVSRDGQAWAIEKGDGRIRWRFPGPPATSVFSGGPGVAARSDIVVFPFPSGMVVGAFADGGLERWTQVIAGARPGQAGSLAATDISGDPVIDGDTLYVGNVSGRVVALNVVTGERLWEADAGAVSPVWPTGGSVFLVSDLSELMRLDAATGETIWRVTLPGFVETRPGRMHTRWAHYGPIVAGGRVIVASSDGIIRQFDTVSGNLIGEIAIASGAASNPVVAGGTLYVISQNGNLVAFR
jgi:outer membrane protein assembly factor BamB